MFASSVVRSISGVVIVLCFWSTHMLAGLDAGEPLESDGREINAWDKCLQRTTEQLCKEEAELARTVQSQIDSGALKAGTPVEFACNESEKPLTMTYYIEFDPPAALITFGEDRVVIFSQRTGSGARYGRAGIEFWEHQGSASVDFYGIKLLCSPVP